MSHLFSDGKYDEPNSFEDALQELEVLVERLEEGEQNLEDMLNTYKKSVFLVKWCYQKLNDTQGEIKILTENSDVFNLEPFQEPDSE